MNPKIKAGPRQSAWPTIWVPLPIVESDRALEAAGCNGLAIYAALHRLRFLAPKEASDGFFASAAQIARFSGISERRLRAPLRALETAGIVTIYRPTGAARLAHQACRYKLLPIFSAANKVQSGEDKATRPKRPVRPTGDGHELGTKMANSIESPLKGDVDTTPQAQPVSVETVGRGEGTENQNPNESW